VFIEFGTELCLPQVDLSRLSKYSSVPTFILNSLSGTDPSLLEAAVHLMKSVLLVIFLTTSCAFFLE
jgi:hypothetical protein